MFIKKILTIYFYHKSFGLPRLKAYTQSLLQNLLFFFTTVSSGVPQFSQQIEWSFRPELVRGLPRLPLPELYELLPPE